MTHFYEYFVQNTTQMQGSWDISEYIYIYIASEVAT